MNRMVMLVSGVIVSLATVLSPLHQVAAELFSAHMVQHLLLVIVAAPLLAAGMPRTISLNPFAIFVLHTGAMWAWHLPSLYDAALTSDALHGLEHLSFLITGVLFWSYVLRGSASAILQRVGLTFAIALQSAALGALLAFASRPLYSSHLSSTASWNMTPLEDQQLAGALMWVPPGIVYLAVMVVLLFRWFGRLDRESVPAPASSGGVR